MSTRALIIGKDKSGRFHYGQSKYDGDDNLEWLQQNMNDVDKVEEFLNYMTEGIDEGGEGHGISFLGYEVNGPWDSRKIDKSKPYIDWYDDGYNCGITDSKEAVLNLVANRHFDFPEYISYWDGEKWENINN